ncbi:hypothetical protein GCM10020221_24590 [Streptomyces thioluteus]|uniref:Uncharacterized protein n=1 Tax=Streptomyces thioluteus TaxID=66431 RepID=A0ABN3WTX6_STRTU
MAPNIVHGERELDVDPHDFRLWVCLHEETHRTQFTAVPWLRDHIEGEVPDVLAETEGAPASGPWWMPCSASSGATSLLEAGGVPGMSSRERVQICSSTSRGCRPAAERVATRWRCGA